MKSADLFFEVSSNSLIEFISCPDNKVLIGTQCWVQLLVRPPKQAVL